ncbi:MAG: hypothetical protein R3E10_07975 [Gemmatimonadota bacterium]
MTLERRSTWSRLGAVAPGHLEDARLQTHHAVQLLAAAGQSRAEPRRDDSHRGFVWSDGAFVGEPLEHARSVRVALDPVRLELQVRRPESGARLALAGSTLAAARGWLSRELTDHPTGSEDLDWPEYEIPAHPVSTGTPFGTPDERHAELARWYGNAASALGALSSREPTASAVRGWPHHFDLATLIAVDPPGATDARSIGVGLSPGDANGAAPYVYVNLWPYPDPGRLPRLQSGRWHTAGWTGAVLSADELLESTDQARTFSAFVDEAVAACRQALA